MRVFAFLAAFCLFTEPLRADTETSRMRIAISTFASKVEDLSDRYVVLLADSLLLDSTLNESFRRHCGIFITSSRNQEAPMGCLLAMGAGITAIVSPFVYLGAHYAPYLTVAASVSVPVSAAIWYFRRPPTLPYFISDRHYQKVQAWRGQARQGLPKIGNAETFLLFHEVMRDRIAERSADLRAALQRRNEPRAGDDLSEDETRAYYIDYLRLWTLAALYEIEVRQYLDSKLDPETRSRVQAELDQLLNSVSVCRSAIIELARPPERFIEGD